MNPMTDAAAARSPRRMDPYMPPAPLAAGAGPAAPAVMSPPPVPCPRSLRIVRVDAYRYDARIGDVLLAYALLDAFGWVLLARRGRDVVDVARVDGPARWNEWAVCARLHSVVHGELAPPWQETPRPGGWAHHGSTGTGLAPGWGEAPDRPTLSGPRHGESVAIPHPG